ncbi:MAG: SOS response-associated peptidase [Alphaproteobacteria bacterium]|nr:SOS response-associated peptidase [Alphaproteobacteria bacterium]
MCNDYRQKRELEALENLIAAKAMRLVYPEGRPNLEPRDDIRITDRAPILRAAAEDGNAVELVQRRWSWPGPGGKPVYNFRSDGREFPSGRCLIVADGFYEFTTHSDPKSKRKHKWLFTLKDEPIVAIAGLWRKDAQVGEAFTMLTTEPGPDMKPYHHRQVVVLPPSDWARWLDVTVPARALLKPLPAGSLEVTQIC